MDQPVADTMRLAMKDLAINPSLLKKIITKSPILKKLILQTLFVFVFDLIF